MPSIPGHPDVHQHDVGAQPVDGPPEPRRAVGDVTHDLDVRRPGEHQRDAGAHQRVVIDDEHPDRRAAGLSFRPGPEPHRFVVDAGADEVGRAAARAGVVLLELREPDTADLEEFFLALTADPSTASSEESVA